ncbi:10678_t:CDS:2, partial [Cetraspora pellucida]
MSKIQNITTSNNNTTTSNTNNKTKINNNRRFKKKQVHYNKVINVNNEMFKIQDIITFNTNTIDVNSKISKNQDTTTSANNKTKFYKLNNYSNKVKK